MGRLNYKARKEIIDYIISTKTKIEVESGVCRFNFRCQYNAVHDAINKEEEKIAMCVYIDDEFPIIHFINVNKKGKYTDNTLGNWSQVNEYYLIKTIDSEDFFKVNDIFGAYRKELRNKLSFWVKFFSDSNF